jgi:hypothetical protein
MSWSNSPSRQSSYDGKSAVVLRGNPIATLPRIPRNDSQETLGMPQIMSGIASVSRAIGEATGFKRLAAETDNSNSVEKDGSQLSSEMIAHILEEAAQSRQKLHNAILNMESGSREWQKMQKSFRQTKTITHFGLAMALQCQLIDTTINSSCVDSSSVAHRRSDSSTGGRCGSAPSLSLDSRRHLFKKEGFKLIKARSHQQLRAAQEKKQSRPRISRMPHPKAVPTKKCEQRYVAQYVVTQPPPHPEWRVVEKSASRHHLIETQSSWKSRLSSSMTSVSSMGLTSFARPHAGTNDKERHTPSYEEGRTIMKNGTFLPWTEGGKHSKEENSLKKAARVVASQLFTVDSDNDD